MVIIATTAVVLMMVGVILLRIASSDSSTVPPPPPPPPPVIKPVADNNSRQSTDWRQGPPSRNFVSDADGDGVIKLTEYDYTTLIFDESGSATIVVDSPYVGGRITDLQNVSRVVINKGTTTEQTVNVGSVATQTGATPKFINLGGASETIIHSLTFYAKSGQNFATVERVRQEVRKLGKGRW